MRARVAHVCNVHTTDDVRVVHKMCAGLCADGYAVDLIAVASGGPRRTDARLRVYELPPPRDRKDRVGRAVAVAKLAASLDPDAYHVHEPEMVAPMLALAGGKPVFFDMKESYGDVLQDRAWVPRAARPLAAAAWGAVQWGLLGRCAGIVTVTPAIAEGLRRWNPHVIVAGNYPDLERLPQGGPARGDPTLCVFAGVLSRDRGLFEVVEALGMLERRGLVVRLALAGWWSPPNLERSLREAAARHGVGDRISYAGMLPNAQIVGFLRTGGIGLATYLPTRNNRIGLPNKLLDCMALGLPVVFSAFPAYAVAARGAGIAVDPTKPAEIADALERLARDPDRAAALGGAGYAAVREKLNWQVERRKLVALYESILGS